MKNIPKNNDLPETHAEVKARIFGGATGNKYAFARAQRHNPTATEAIMWTELRGKKIGRFQVQKAASLQSFRT